MKSFYRACELPIYCNQNLWLELDGYNRSRCKLQLILIRLIVCLRTDKSTTTLRYSALFLVDSQCGSLNKRAVAEEDDFSDVG